MRAEKEEEEMKEDAQGLRVTCLMEEASRTMVSGLHTFGLSLHIQELKVEHEARGREEPTGLDDLNR